MTHNCTHSIYNLSVFDTSVDGFFTDAAKQLKSQKMFLVVSLLLKRSSSHLPGAKQDRFGVMTFLRLIGRLAQDGVSDPVPEWVTFHSTFTQRERERESFM